MEALRRGPSGALAGGFLAVVFWGLSPVATRALVLHLSPLPLLVLRLPIAGAFLLPWAIPLFRRIRRRDLPRLVGGGLLSLVGYNFPVTAGLRWVHASTAGLLLGTEPLWVLAAGWVLAGEQVRRRAWAGGLVALVGVAVLVGPSAFTASGRGHELWGVLLVLLATVCFSTYTIVLRPLSDAYGALPTTAATTAIGVAPYLAFVWTIPTEKLAHLGGTAWGELAFLAFGSTAAGLLLWNRAVSAAGSGRTGMLLSLQPLVSVAGAATFLGEPLHPATVVGGMLVVTGVAAGAVGPVRRRGGMPQASAVMGAEPVAPAGSGAATPGGPPRSGGT